MQAMPLIGRSIKILIIVSALILQVILLFPVRKALARRFILSESLSFPWKDTASLIWCDGGKLMKSCMLSTSTKEESWGFRILQVAHFYPSSMNSIFFFIL